MEHMNPYAAILFGVGISGVIVVFVKWLLSDTDSRDTLKLYDEIARLRKNLDDNLALIDVYKKEKQKIKIELVQERYTASSLGRSALKYYEETRALKKRLVEKDEEYASLNRSFNAYMMSSVGMHEVDCTRDFVLKIGNHVHTCHPKKASVSLDILESKNSTFSIEGTVSKTVVCKNKEQNELDWR